MTPASASSMEPTEAQVRDAVDAFERLLRAGLGQESAIVKAEVRLGRRGIRGKDMRLCTPRHRARGRRA